MSDPSKIVLAIKATALPPESSFSFGGKTGTPPTEPTHYTFALYLVNRGCEPFTAELQTGGHYSLDDVLVRSKGANRTLSVDPHCAVLLSEPDEGAFDESFYYKAKVVFESGEVFEGVFGVSRYGHAPLDQYENDPVLQARVRVIQARSWDIPVL